MKAAIGILERLILQTLLLGVVVLVVILFAKLGNEGDLRRQLKNGAYTIQRLAQDCSQPRMIGSGGTIPIAQAYLSVEQVARSPIRQKLEIHLAQLFWLLGYPSPIHTLGIGQIAESTFERENLRSWLIQNVSKTVQNEPFWEIAQDTCLSLAMTYRLTDLYLLRESNDLQRVLDHLHGPSTQNKEARRSRVVYDYLFEVALNEHLLSINP
ncbi:MAG: hypothetical protein WA214_24805 [Pseudolabrys sp.]